MSTTTADVLKLKCIFFNKVAEFAGNSQYGIDCDETALFTEIERLYTRVNFGCFHDEYGNEILADETTTYCDRTTFELPEGEEEGGGD